MNAEKLMRRALHLAAQAQGGTSPNPMVGAVIVRDGEILGEGYHQRAGKPHAEIEALRAAAGHDLTGATMAVSLEPCCHHGRTGPCTQAIIDAKISRVYVAARDPNPRVAGQGIATLRAADIEVIEGILSPESTALNTVFNHWMRHGRPWIHLKLAISLDGRIAAAPGQRTPITGPESQAYVHRLRAYSDAVLVGTRTADIDRPSLNVRYAMPNPHAQPPWRLILDSQLRLDPTIPALEPTAPGAILATALPLDHPKAQALHARGIRVLSHPDPHGRVDLPALFQALAQGDAPLTSILCEGGGLLAASLLEHDLVDALTLLQAPLILGAGGVPAFGPLQSPIRGFTRTETRPLGEDLMIHFRATARAPDNPHHTAQAP